MQPGDMMVVRSGEPQDKGAALEAVKRLRPPPAGIIASSIDDKALPGLPLLRVADTGGAILAMGEYARLKFSGKVLAVTGSAGKTTTVAMLRHALVPWGGAEQTRHNANLPHGVAWNLASMGWTVPHIVLELAIGRMGQSARMARPDIAVFTNVLPAHLGEHSSIADIARTKSAIFSGMLPGGIAVLNRDMSAWRIVYEAARARGLRVLHYGSSDECEFRLVDYSARKREVTALVHSEKFTYELGAGGSHMALNSLAVLAALYGLGYAVAPALEQLRSFSALEGRGTEHVIHVGGKQLTIVDDAYNANPGSMAAAIHYLGERKNAGRKVAVLGEMAELGPGTKEYHNALATLVEQYAIDKVYVVGQHYEGFWPLISASRQGCWAHSLDELKSVLLSDLTDGDMLLFKGSHSTRIHSVVDWIKRLSETPSQER
ncbi:UDP-N-acetylmuramoyl-tripeptide--D-alanyl-D-alanine ligase [Ensifer sp. SL37]|uniref:UDP-N-acetylmuramoyl-tripeptide--D-alanyl-D- alanine ligase n=1 Tax=Ensifer sp. SL37 TaxID=2995137 RepID=UPI0022751479|nr:UDP-N-acetylmuramoyl-tripeptide--D-alanyl-D-alanine ligase [Ensifer sp. SL37]MCY1740492.1 UDP-N-acetylmuramoyl-tripeptide--D-alanyl-D-alanine ligase [Ensifer sp. SL37]